MAGLDSFYPNNADESGEQRSYSSLSTPGGRSPLRRRRVVEPFHYSSQASFEHRDDENEGRFTEYNSTPLQQVTVFRTRQKQR